MGKSLQGGRLVSNSRIFVDSGGNIGIGSTQPTSKFDITGDVKITGISTFAGDVSFGSTATFGGDDRLRFGDNNEFDIYYSGGKSFIKSGVGQLRIKAASSILLMYENQGGTQTESYATFSQNGSVSLFYDGNKKFETTTTGATVTGTLVSDLDLSAISSSISDTAVDIFVYDTRKDSDGGAWRKRTQHTSWYNETLNTATRGSRREFPSVAVIVMQEGTLTIYDGDDPDLPMWMVFTDNNDTGSLFASAKMLSCRTATSIFMLNGMFVCGGKAPYHDAVTEINFLTDSAKKHMNNGYYYNTLNISQRESTGGYYTVTSGTPGIVNNLINDVAMSVLPNAPIDDATGLPIPTIAVATDGGASIIRDDGTVADLTGFNPVQTIHIDDSSVIGSTISGVNDYIFKTRIPPSDESYNAGIIAGSKNYYLDSLSGSTPLLRDIDVACTEYDSKNETTYRGGTTGLDIIAPGQAISNNSSKVAVAYATTSYNTGYMVGDIKGAFLSDTDTTNVTGSELITNGDFEGSNTTGWTAESGLITNFNSSYGSVALIITNSGGVTSNFYQSFTTEIGVTYIVSLDQQGGPIIKIFDGSGVSGTTLLTITTSTSGNFETGETGTFVATSTTSTIALADIPAGGGYLYDNISVRKAELDRSVNNNALQVFGTITKSAVATGADLVGYSGFSASNYLQQPYNSDLDFGTGDFSVIFWYKSTSGNAQCILHRGDGGTGTWGSGPIIQIEFNGTNLAAFLADSGFSSSDTVGIPIATSANSVWNHYVLTRSGGTMNVYFNGSLYGSASSTRTLTNTSAKTWIGERPNLTRPASSTSMALFRMSASVPSPEQIKKIYEDEKVLFQENAKCTLYGSSDAVTALAYDDSTNLLYAGTSSGRSDFQGLRRINNTTTAVTTAMSASNGLVAEQ